MTNCGVLFTIWLESKQSYVRTVRLLVRLFRKFTHRLVKFVLCPVSLDWFPSPILVSPVFGFLNDLPLTSIWKRAKVDQVYFTSHFRFLSIYVDFSISKQIEMVFLFSFFLFSSDFEICCQEHAIGYFIYIDI